MNANNKNDYKLFYMFKFIHKDIVNNILHRYIHQQNYRDVVNEYKEKWVVLFDDNGLVFYYDDIFSDYNAQYRDIIKNQRINGGIYRFFKNAIEGRVGHLPQRYIYTYIKSDFIE